MKKKPEPKPSKQETEKRKLFDAVESRTAEIRRCLKVELFSAKDTTTENLICEIIRRVNGLHEIMSDLLFEDFTPGHILKELKKRAT